MAPKKDTKSTKNNAGHSHSSSAASKDAMPKGDDILTRAKNLLESYEKRLKDYAHEFEEGNDETRKQEALIEGVNKHLDRLKWQHGVLQSKYVSLKDSEAVKRRVADKLKEIVNLVLEYEAFVTVNSSRPKAVSDAVDADANANYPPWDIKDVFDLDGASR